MTKPQSPSAIHVQKPKVAKPRTTKVVTTSVETAEEVEYSWEETNETNNEIGATTIAPNDYAKQIKLVGFPNQVDKSVIYLELKKHFNVTIVNEIVFNPYLRVHTLQVSTIEEHKRLLDAGKWTDELQQVIHIFANSCSATDFCVSWPGLEEQLDLKELVVLLRRMQIAVTGFFQPKSGKSITQHPTLEDCLRTLEVTMVAGVRLNTPKYYPNPNPDSFVREAAMKLKVTNSKLALFPTAIVNVILSRIKSITQQEHLLHVVYPRNNASPATLYVTLRGPEMVKKVLQRGLSFVVKGKVTNPKDSSLTEENFIMMVSVVIARKNTKKESKEITNKDIMIKNEQLVQQNDILFQIIANKDEERNQVKPPVFDLTEERVHKRPRTDTDFSDEEQIVIEDNSQEVKEAVEDEDEILV